MSISKPWDWAQVKEDRWLIPSEDSFYLLERWKQQGYSKFLDLGCGKGRHAIQFATSGFHVWAADLSEYAVKELEAFANQHELSMKVAVCDMMNLPYPNDSFDCLMAYHVISHSNTEGVFQTMREIHRVVKGGGEVFLTFCARQTLLNRAGQFHFIEDNVIIKDDDGPEKGIPHFYTDEETLLRLLAQFDVVSVRLSQNVDLTKQKEYGFHYFVLAKVKK